MSYIKLRAGLISCPQLTMPGRVRPICSLCHSSGPSTSHIVCECPATSAPRGVLQTTLREICPQLCHTLASSTSEEASNIILGGFVSLVPEFFLPSVRRACVLYASEVAAAATDD
jgi:hypothetical protein